jgi:hypothetical protein
MARTILRPGLFEKIGMIALVSIIFGQVLKVHAEPLELSIIMAVIVFGNAALSTILERRGFGPTAALRQFLFTGILNLAIMGVIAIVFEVLGNPVDLLNTFFYLLLITLLITLYDRYRPEYLARFAKDEAPAGT